ncbi:MAG: protein TolQ [Acidithiobacillales bacterium SG8_45]|jgi:biopolymer transport protein TolQ|nr:MAG: protein TolQ [Acidithiobacillales bacterium SG8_45]
MTSADSLSIGALIANASLPVQLVMLLLLVASFISWMMIFLKWFQLRNARRSTDRFEEKFWSGTALERLYTEVNRKDVEATGIESIFLAGFRELRRQEQQGGATKADILEAVRRAMRVALTEEIDYLETHLSFLATVGSTSPYVGLFGTVWGIMNSFRSLGASSQATIAQVAPGIAEALIATAMGLFAAIPAVIAYNRYSNNVERLVTRYEIFVEEFSSIVQRQVAK